MAKLCVCKVPAHYIYGPSPESLTWTISEVFVIVSVTLFLPICLEQFARDNGYLLPDRSSPCSSLPSNVTESESERRCVVKIGWAWVDSASYRWSPTPHVRLTSVLPNGWIYSLYVYSLSVALQALTVISMGSIADHRRCRFPFILTPVNITVFHQRPTASASFLPSRF